MLRSEEELNPTAHASEPAARRASLPHNCGVATQMEWEVYETEDCRCLRDRSRADLCFLQRISRVVSPRVARRALTNVAGELTPGGPIEPAALRARFSPIGEGLFVYPADVVERGRPPLVWLIKGGQPYALNETARALTPRLPEAREIPTELLTAEESTAQLEAMVWLSLTRGTFVGERPEYELARP